MASEIIPSPELLAWEEELRAAGRTEGRTEGRAEGRAQGLAAAVLTVLGARGIEIGSEDRRRIETCSEADVLLHWLRRAASVQAAADLFRE